MSEILVGLCIWVGDKTGITVTQLPSFPPTAMKPNLETLRKIRQITEDGIVTDEEVMSLGSYLNENSVARKSWPGNVCFELLKRIFDDARLEPHELEALAYILRGIELQCCGALGQFDEAMADDGIASDAKFEVIDFKLPALSGEMQVQANEQTKKISNVDLSVYECDCGDWTAKRFLFGDNSPGRLCRCLVIALRQPEIECEIPRLDWNIKLFQLLDLFTETDGCFDAVPTWKLLRLGGREWVAAWGDREWCIVYTENSEGALERYCYHINERRWAYGATPVGAGALKNFFVGYDEDAEIGGDTSMPTIY